ncbi:Bce2p [Castilleja foliolosa]|uniref:Dihydrolipoamide acetyltransferase component of pyruvate dehydrogenase complex n=1 Tax=Castilleja foliolosa TaxID=1961234 RepID=A0ABD3CAZ6_9LAMI
MICRRICRKNPWSFSQRWRSVSSAAAPPSSNVAGFEIISTIRAPAIIFMKPRKLFYFRNPYKGNCLSISFGTKGCNLTTQAISDHPIDGVVDVPLAQTGEGIAECELLKWFVNEGDEVDEFQPICEVQSDKATIEITSRYKGKVLKFIHAPGNIVKVGETLLKMVVDDNAFPSQHLGAPEITKPPLVSNASELDVVDIGFKKANIGGVVCTPAVRNFAKQLGVDIENVPGTGKDGRVLKEDVSSYASNEGILKESLGLYTASSDEREYEDRTITLRGFQRAMVKSMTLAAKIPHFHYVDEIKCNSLVELKTSFQNENSDPGVKHTFLPVLIKSLSMALTKYPLLNSCFNEELQEVTLKGSHNIGIAMATPHGLVVPNIKKVQSLSILEITKELSRLQQSALANKLSSDDISGGTITVSNIGAIGGKFGSPLINVPETSIIAIGKIQKVPQFDDDENVYPALIMTVNIGADHRVLDGATVAKFCNEWKLFIEKPELLMLQMR